MRKRIIREFLRDTLTQKELGKINASFDVIGDIAVIKMPSNIEAKENLIAEAVMKANGNVKTVLNQVAPVSGEFRLRRLEWIGGEKRTTTIHREYGCVFKTDLAEVYFSPRLSYERMRISKIIRPSEVIINMFAGVGCFSIILAKHCDVSKIYSIDINPIAVGLMRENVSLNKVEKTVDIIHGDSREIIEKNLKGAADRILMPLPEKAYDYLDAAVFALKPGVGFIHYYDFVHAKKGEKPVEKVVKKLEERMKEIKVTSEVITSRIVRTIGPNWYQIVLDVKTST